MPSKDYNWGARQSRAGLKVPGAFGLHKLWCQGRAKKRFVQTAKHASSPQHERAFTALDEQINRADPRETSMLTKPKFITTA